MQPCFVLLDVQQDKAVTYVYLMKDDEVKVGNNLDCSLRRGSLMCGREAVGAQLSCTGISTGRKDRVHQGSLSSNARELGLNQEARIINKER